MDPLTLTLEFYHWLMFLVALPGVAVFLAKISGTLYGRGQEGHWALSALAAALIILPALGLFARMITHQ